MKRTFFLWTLGLLLSAPSVTPAQTVAMFLDTSGSMTGERAEAMKQAAKLAVAMLDDGQELIVVPFNHEAHRLLFSLRTKEDRGKAMRAIDAQRIDGGTDYLAALKTAQLPTKTPSIFLTDGEHNGSPEPVLEFLRNNPPGPLFTVAIQAPPQADQLLIRMASLTGGHHTRVDNSEGLVKAFLDITKFLGKYRVCQPQEDRVEFAAVTGRFIAIGLDAVPVMNAKPAFGGATFKHQAQLPGEKVTLLIHDLPLATHLTVQATQKRTAQGRLILLRNDLPVAKTHLDTMDGKVPADGTVKAKTTYVDKAGNTVDPRKRSDLTSELQVINASGKVISQRTSQPSATEPALEATLKMPKQPGAVTIRNVTKAGSQGSSFEAKEERTLIVEEFHSLSATPLLLQQTTREGRFQAKVTLTVADAPNTLARFTAHMESKTEQVRLLSSTSKDKELVLEFEALTPGVFRGALVIHALATVSVESLQLPFEFTVTSRFMGLKLASDRTFNLGTFLANSDRKEVALLDIPSLDTEATPYTVEVEDLATGATAIPLTADKLQITPTKDKPAQVRLFADIGNVQAGLYQARAIFKAAGASPKEWTTKLSLTVSEPLSAEALDFGKVQAGKVIQQALILRNAGGALQNLRWTMPSFQVDGGLAVLTIPENANAVAGNQEKQILLSLAISPLVKTKGLVRGHLSLRRTAQQELKIPVSFELVDAGTGRLLVAPAKLEMTAKAGEVVEFTTRVRCPADGTTIKDTLTAAGSGFRDAEGRAVPLEMTFKWSPGNTITCLSPATATGYFLAPARVGSYDGTLIIQSEYLGTVSVPFRVTVE